MKHFLALLAALLLAGCAATAPAPASDDNPLRWKPRKQPVYPMPPYA